MEKKEEYSWLKNKGYLHLTPQINILTRRKEIISKVTNPTYVARYAFFPLIHSSIKERKYKRGEANSSRRHSHKNGNKIISNAKNRPLHYASHMDSLILGYYAQILLGKYEEEILKHQYLSESVLAYRKIPIEKNPLKNKSTLHFAKEVFDQIKLRSNPDCAVLKYDIKSFFNRMDHKILLNIWMKVLNVQRLPDDHFNVYKACTRFSYVLKDDFRLVKHLGSGRKSGFDEKKIADIRNTNGINSFYSSIEEFRLAIKSGELKIHRFPFKYEKGEEFEGLPRGIPQGLPISAVLANLYLLDFDLATLDEIVNKHKGFYRRYSDDIIIICSLDQAKIIDGFVTSKIKESRVEMSLGKKEEFVFKQVSFSPTNTALCSIRIDGNTEKVRFPLTYLGFEFYGYKTLIKSTNLAKFYRRMISTVRKKSRRALASNKKNPDIIPALFYNQLRRLYTLQNLNTNKIRKNIKFIEANERGSFSLKTKKINRKFNSNYIKYIGRVNKIMGGNTIIRQVRKNKSILRKAIHKNFNAKK